MKHPTSIILCILASLAFGCEVTHPIDPAFDNCRQAGGTWKDQNCLCPNDVTTVCRNNKLFTCSYGIFDQGIDCPGVCKDDTSCILEIDNIECEESSLSCNYMNIHDQNLYICNNGKLVLHKACLNGCINDKCVTECDPGETECVGMYEKFCSEGFWKIGKYCPWGCEGNKCKCHKGDEICHNNTKYTCENGDVQNKGPCDNACGMGDVKCTDEGKILQCTNGNWPSETHAVSGICEDGRLTNCKEVADGFVLNRETCENGCDETGKSCKQASDNPETPCENDAIDCGTNGCKDNQSCHSSSITETCVENSKKCDDNNTAVMECVNGQWKTKSCDDKGCVNGNCGECVAGSMNCSDDNQLYFCTGSPTKYNTIECAKGCDYNTDTCIDSCQNESISCTFESGSHIFKICNNDNVSQFVCDKCQSDSLCETVTSAVDCNNLPSNIECEMNSDAGSTIKCIEDKLGCIQDSKTKAITICTDHTLSVKAEYPKTYDGWYELYTQYAPSEITALNNALLDNIFESDLFNSKKKLHICKNNKFITDISEVDENSSYNLKDIQESKLSDYTFCIDNTCNECLSTDAVNAIYDIHRECDANINTQWGNLASYE